MVARVRLSDMTLYDGASCGSYVRAVEALSGSLMRHNAAVIEVGSDDAAFIHCGLEAARSYFRGKSLSLGKGSRGVYMYWAGRALEDWDSSPPCMADVFRCMGKAARAALFAIARYLRLRSDVFNHLLDDTPLPANEVSSSVLVATYSHASLQNGKGAIGGGKPAINGELEKGLLTLISSDSSGLQMQLQEGSGAGANGLPAGFHEYRQVLQLSNSGASCRSPKQRRIRNAPRKYVGFCGLHLHLLLCSSTIHALGGRLRITFCSLNLLRLAPAQPWTSHFHTMDCYSYYCSLSEYSLNKKDLVL
ncbi:hypothetical protein ACOSQ3_017833 [Xanthoceras sorbifolium]